MEEPELASFMDNNINNNDGEQQQHEAVEMITTAVPPIDEENDSSSSSSSSEQTEEGCLCHGDPSCDSCRQNDLLDIGSIEAMVTDTMTSSLLSHPSLTRTENHDTIRKRHFCTILCDIAKAFPNDLSSSILEMTTIGSTTTTTNMTDSYDTDDDHVEQTKRLRMSRYLGIGPNGYCSIHRATVIKKSISHHKQVVYAPSPQDYFLNGATILYVPRPEWFRTAYSIISLYISAKSSSNLDGITERCSMKENKLDCGINGNDYIAFSNDNKYKIFDLVGYNYDLHIWERSTSHCSAIMCKQSDIKMKAFGKHYDTILHLAIRENATEAAQAIILIEYNTWIDSNPRYQPYDPHCTTFLKSTILEMPNKRGVTPLILAAQKGNVTIVRTLLQCGVNLTTKTENGFSAILQAAHFGHTDVIECIARYHSTLSYIRNSVSLRDLLNMATLNQTTPLMRAAQEGHISTVRSLLKHGADLRRRNNMYMTSLMLAAQRGHAKVCQLLISQGAGIDVKTRQNSTPLSLACLRGHIDVVRVLVGAGCDLYITDDRNRTIQQTLEQRLRRLENHSNNNNDLENDDADDMGDALTQVRTIRAILQLLDPRTQIALMQHSVRVERNYQMILMYTLLHQNRSNFALVDADYSLWSPRHQGECIDLRTAVQWIQTLSKIKASQPPVSIQPINSKPPSWLANTSTQTLVLAMTLPAPLLQTIALYLPTPNLRYKRNERMQLLALSGKPNVAVDDALDLIDEILEEMGFLSACDIAEIPAPIPHLSWCDWKRSIQSAKMYPLTNTSHETARGATASQPNLTESGPPVPKDERNPYIWELRRQVGYLPLLEKYQSQTEIVSILLDPPYRMSIPLLQKLIRIADIASVCRRCCVASFDHNNNDHTINFGVRAATDIIDLAERFAAWHSRQDSLDDVNNWEVRYRTEQFQQQVQQFYN